MSVFFSYSMMKVEVDSGSQYFASKDGSLYDKKDGQTGMAVSDRWNI